MKFKEIYPRNISIKNKSSIKSYFRKNKCQKSFSLTIILGKEIYEKFTFIPGKKIKIFINEDNNRIILLKKSEDENGFTLSKNFKSNEAKLTLTWRAFIPTEEEMISKEIKFDAYEENLRIFLKDSDYLLLKENLIKNIKEKK